VTVCFPVSPQVALFKRLLVMIRNLRMEADRMHAMACICRASLSLDLFMKESARRGQRPISGTDVTSLFGDSRELKEEIAPAAPSGEQQTLPREPEHSGVNGESVCHGNRSRLLSQLQQFCRAVAESGISLEEVLACLT